MDSTARVFAKACLYRKPGEVWRDCCLSSEIIIAETHGVIASVVFRDGSGVELDNGWGSLDFRESDGKLIASYRIYSRISEEIVHG